MIDPELDDWLDSIHGLDRGGWWLPIVCTHGGPMVEADVIGALFDHRERGSLSWAPRALWLNPEGTKTRALIHLTRLDDDERDSVRSEGAGGVVRFGMGSINTECTRHHTARFSREAWAAAIEAARRTDGLTALDVFGR